VIALVDGGEGNTIAWSAMADESGEVIFVGVPPRRYWLLAMRVPPPSTLQNGGGIVVHPSPDTLDLLWSSRRLSERVDVRPGETVAVTLEPR
jgi:hypothetical protein